MQSGSFTLQEGQHKALEQIDALESKIVETFVRHVADPTFLINVSDEGWKRVREKAVGTPPIRQQQEEDEITTQASDARTSDAAQPVTPARTTIRRFTFSSAVQSIRRSTTSTGYMPFVTPRRGQMTYATPQTEEVIIDQARTQSREQVASAPTDMDHVHNAIIEDMGRKDALQYMGLDLQVYTYVRDKLSPLQKRECARQTPTSLDSRQGSGRLILNTLRTIAMTRPYAVDFTREQRAWSKQKHKRPDESIRSFQDRITEALTNYMQAGGAVNDQEFFYYIKDRVETHEDYKASMRDLLTRSRISGMMPRPEEVWMSLQDTEQYVATSPSKKTNMPDPDLRLRANAAMTESDIDNMTEQELRVELKKHLKNKNNDKAERICKFHQQGHCKKGDKCDYKHIPKRESKETKNETDKETKKDHPQANKSDTEDDHRPFDKEPRPPDYNLQHFDWSKVKINDSAGHVADDNLPKYETVFP